MKCARFVFPFAVFAITTVLAQSNPVPFINQPLVPTAVAPGGPSFTLTVNGSGFVSGSVINWNGTPLTTTLVNGSQLTATVPASSIANASTASITVSSPSPGGGASNLLFFSVSAPTSLQFTSLQITPPGECGPCFNFIAADFNRDRKLDLAFDVLLRAPAGRTSLGNGDGTFQAPVGPAGRFNFSVVADFNGDGKLDMVGVGQSITIAPYFAAVELGNDDGTFSPGSTIASGNQSNDPTGFQVAAADFNRDGKLDVAIGDDLGIEVYLGNGDGTFQAGLPPVGGGVAFGQAVGDFNGDGILDMAEIVGTEPNLQLQILLGNGDGTFQTGADYPGFGSAASLIFPADLNGDNKLDLTIVQTVNPPDPTSVTVLLGNGDGTFGTPTNYLVGSSLGGGALADFNADGKLDVMVSTSTNTVPSTTIMVGNGDGTFQSPSVLPILANGSVAAGDYNNDGKLDLAVAVAIPPANGVFVLLQEVPQPSLSLSSVTFGSQVVGTTSSPQGVTLANTNNGTAPLTLSSIVITGANAGDFSQTNNCPASLAVGANCQINIIFVPTATDVRNASLSITDNATNSPQMASLTGVGQDFSLAPGSQTTATVSPGQSASYTVAVAPSGGFNQTVTLSCSGAPAHSTCSMSPSSVTLSGSATTATVTVTTAGGSAGLTRPVNGPGGNMFGSWLALSGTLGPAMLVSLGSWRRKRHPRLLYGLTFLCLFSIGVTISACGGGGSSGSGGSGTPAGTYNLTVTGTFTSGSTNLTHKTNFTLVVQ
jgi:hypothetical protein